MTNILALISQGESITVEFKESKSKLNKDVFESVCAFLNRHGGHLFLGVRDNGEIVGVDEDKIEGIKKDFLTAINNPQKLNPPVYLSADIIEIEDKKIISVFIPESSSVHSVNGRIYDRNGDGDFDITGRTDQVAQLYLRKQNNYTENKIFPFATMEDLKPDLLKKVRQMASNQREDVHPWEGMNDLDMLKSAGLYAIDKVSGKEGLTLAAILLFGTEEAIINVLPHHKTDAILRRVNLDRYDDRDIITVNLIESYTRMMEFVKKHLNDPFYLEDDVRMSLRNKIFREAVANSLIHREYSSAFIAKMVIEKERVLFENANRPHGFGTIDPINFTPYPKNPAIAKMFREIGYADELGSGVKNLYKYAKVYGGSDPELIEGDVFKIIIPTKDEEIGKGNISIATWKPQVLPKHTTSNPQVLRTNKIVEFCQEPRSRSEIQTHIGIKDRKYFMNKILNPLLEKGILQLTDQENPNNPNQKYVVSEQV